MISRPNWIPLPLWVAFMRQRDRRKHLRRQLIRFVRHPRLAIAYARYRQAVNDADWPLVKERVLALTQLAEQLGDRRVAQEMTAALERVGCYREGARLWFSEIAGNAKQIPNEWRGEDLAGKTLLINLNEDADQGLGIGYRCAHIVANLIGRARRTIAFVNPRLVPTYQRTFPALEVTASRADRAMESADYIALPTYLMMNFDLGGDHGEFRRLLPDPETTAALRKKYIGTRNGSRPLIGLCWYSSHHGKDLPALHYWRDFVARTDATFVSLQYGNAVQDVQAIGADRVIIDETVDQLKDMDRFAAQVSALDGVVTVISTLANVGSALGVPTVVLRDDWFRRNTPHLTDRVPWFPQLRFAGRNRRDWASVFDEALEKLRTMWREGAPTARRTV